MQNLYADKPYAHLTPQCQTLLTHFATTDSISNLEAQGVYKIRSLPRRIRDLIEVGYKFEKQWRKDVTGQKYMRYVYLGWEDPKVQKALDTAECEGVPYAGWEG